VLGLHYPAESSQINQYHLAVRCAQINCFKVTRLSMAFLKTTHATSPNAPPIKQSLDRNDKRRAFELLAE